jgi:hypothetical protein
MQVAGSSHGVNLDQLVQPLVVPAPPEGVVGRAFTSGSRKGRPSTVLPHGAKQVWAIFEFAAKPKAGLRATVSWYARGKLVGTRPAQRNLFVVASGVTYGRPLQPGTWECRLQVGGKLVRVVRARIR